MYQDERTITPNNEENPANIDWLRLKIFIKNTSSHRFKITHKLVHGMLISINPVVFVNNESDSHESDSVALCDAMRETEIIFEQYWGAGPQGKLYFKDVDNSNIYFDLYFDLSIIGTDPRNTYVFPRGDYSMVSPICCFPTEGQNNTYVAEFTISDPVLCNNFYHVSDTHFGRSFGDKEYIEKFNYIHRILFDRINSDVQALGLIHTGDICDDDTDFSDYCNYYLKAGKVGDDFKPKYLKNLYEGYGNHDGSDVINRIKDRHEYGSTIESCDQCVCEDYDSNKLHYYWDWHGVRFIHLNLAPIDGKDGNDALKYLNNVLDKWGHEKPVILCFHYIIALDFENDPEIDFLSSQQKKAFWDEIKDYNICAILCGHAHGIGQYYFGFKYENTEYKTNIPCYCAGAMKPNYIEKEQLYDAYYYKYEFDDNNKKITVYRNIIEFPNRSEPRTSERVFNKIDIKARKKPTCDVKPASSEEV